MLRPVVCRSAASLTAVQEGGPLLVGTRRAPPPRPRRSARRRAGLVLDRDTRGVRSPDWSLIALPQQRADGLDRVRVLRLLIAPPAGHAGEADSDAGAVARGFADALEREFEDELRPDSVDGPEALDGVAADERVHLADLLIAQPGIGFGERNQLAVLPDAERVIRKQAGAASVARLRIDQDAIDRVRIDLPFPPVAAAPAHTIRRAQPLQHEAFDFALPRFLPQRSQLVPIRAAHERREHEPLDALHRRFELRAPPFDGALARILAAPFQQIEGHQDRRHLRQDLRAERLAADAPLHRAERERRAVLPRHDLAIEHGSLREARAGGGDFREAVCDELLAARPEERLAAAADQLRADAVPLPFDLPFAWVAEVLGRAFERVGEAEWIGPAGVGFARFGRDEPRPELGRRLPLAHQPVGNGLGREAAGFGERAHNQALRHAHAEFAGDEFIPGETLALVHVAPRGDEPGAAGLVVSVAHREQALLDPPVQRLIARMRGRREQQRDQFGEVSDRVVALGEKPVRHAGLFDGPLRQLARFEQALGTPSDEKADG